MSMNLLPPRTHHLRLPIPLRLLRHPNQSRSTPHCPFRRHERHFLPNSRHVCDATTPPPSGQSSSSSPPSAAPTPPKFQTPPFPSNVPTPEYPPPCHPHHPAARPTVSTPSPARPTPPARNLYIPPPPPPRPRWSRRPKNFRRDRPPRWIFFAAWSTFRPSPWRPDRRGMCWRKRWWGRRRWRRLLEYWPFRFFDWPLRCSLFLFLDDCRCRCSSSCPHLNYFQWSPCRPLPTLLPIRHCRCSKKKRRRSVLLLDSIRWTIPGVAGRFRW
mmetsp:Transcript_31341/g.66326  ORF Transcript_31341/g.66326 Transcript_31341/m.66326 type:complete len:270 (+) Transcript_31341:1281-2090(+)